MKSNPDRTSGMALQSASGAEIMAKAVQAAEKILREWDIDRAAVVINVAWRENEIEYAMSSGVPRRYRKMMAASLAESLEEAS